MLKLSVSYGEDDNNSPDTVLTANLVEVPSDHIHRATIPRFTLPSGREIDIIAHGDYPHGGISIVVAEGRTVLAQAAGSYVPYLNLWVRIDEIDIFSHLEPEVGEQSVTPKSDRAGG